MWLGLSDQLYADSEKRNVNQEGTNNFEASLDETRSLDSGRPLPISIKHRTSPCLQASISTDATKERALSATSQRLEQLQKGEVKKLLKSLGSLAKTREQPRTNNKSVRHISSLKETNSLKGPRDFNRIPPQDPIEYLTIDTILTSEESKHLKDTPCPV